MKLQEALQNSDLDKVLDGLPDDYDRIKKFRGKLDEPARDLFDSVFLIGFREGILLNLYRETHNGICGCKFIVDYGRAGTMCRLGHKLGTPECEEARTYESK